MQEEIQCACGCGNTIEKFDKWGRERSYISGHNGRKYVGKKTYKKVWYEKVKNDKEYKRKSYENGVTRCRRLKAELVEKNGGKCSICGMEYDGTNACIFDMHHRDKGQKLFNVNVGAFNNYSLEMIYEEAKKCDMVCANCHRLIHKAVDY